MSDRTGFLGISQAGWTAIASLSTLCAFVSFFFGLYQYTASLEEQRAERTLELLKEWRSDGYRDSFQKLAGYTTREIDENLTDSELAFLQGNAGVQSSVAAKISQGVLSNNPDADAALDEVVYFFNLLGLCVEARMCSEATAEGFFENTLQDFHFMFATPIEERRSTLPDYGSGMLGLLQRFQATG